MVEHLTSIYKALRLHPQHGTEVGRKKGTPTTQLSRRQLTQSHTWTPALQHSLPARANLHFQMHAECIAYTGHVGATEEPRAEPEPRVPTSANPAWHSEAIARPPSKTREAKGRVKQQLHVFQWQAKATLPPGKAELSPTLGKVGQANGNVHNDCCGPSVAVTGQRKLHPKLTWATQQNTVSNKIKNKKIAIAPPSGLAGRTLP